MANLVDLIEKHKLIRRLTLIWAIVLITVVVERATEPEVLSTLTPAGGSVVVAVIGILATVIAFYQHHRSKE